MTTSPDRSRNRGQQSTWSVWLGWTVSAALAALGAASGGLSGFLIMSGLVLLLVALVATIRGRVRWALLRSRVAGVSALAVALAVIVVGGAVADTEPAGRIAASETSSVADEPAPTSSPSDPSAGSPSRQPSDPTTSVSPSTPGADTALALLATLPVKGRAPKTGYDRDQFGQAWADVDRNGCDTRNDILRRDLTELVVESGTHGCVVLTGRLDGPYTGESIDFVRGAATSSAVQIDHVVALSDAWQKGGQQLRLGARTALANDPLNLLAVDGPTNASKGDGDAATWLPPSKHFRCAYVARQVAVKARYDLWVTRAEHDAIERVLTACPDTVVPTSEPVPLGGGRTGTPEPTSGPTPTRKPTRRGTGSTDPRFDTCTAAIDAGYGPYVRGKDAEYGWYDDRDADGTVCE